MIIHGYTAYNVISSYNQLNIVYVNPSSNLNSSYIDGSQTYPCPDITCGLIYANIGATIYLEKGLYIGSNNTNLCSDITDSTGNNQLNSSILVCNQNSNIKIIGLGLPTEVIISCIGSPINDRFLYINDNNVINVMNLTISNCYLNSQSNFNEVLSSVYDDRIFKSSIVYSGGGISILNTDLQISNVIFYNNSAYNGGSLLISSDSNVNISNTIFESNIGTVQGGSMLIERSNVNIDNTLFSKNEASGLVSYELAGRGGCISFDSIYGNNQLSIRHSSFINNIAYQSGGAIYIQSSSVLESRRNLISSKNEYDHESRNTQTSSETIDEDVVKSVERELSSSVNIDIVVFISYNNTYDSNKVSGLGDCSSKLTCTVRGGAIVMNALNAIIEYDVYINNRVTTTNAVQQVD